MNITNGSSINKQQTGGLNKGSGRGGSGAATGKAMAIYDGASGTMGANQFSRTQQLQPHQPHSSQQPIQVVGSQYSKNPSSNNFLKNPYTQKQKLQPGSKAQSRARTASKPRGAMLPHDGSNDAAKMMSNIDEIAPQLAGKRGEKTGNVIGGIRIKIVDKKKATNTGGRGGAVMAQDSRMDRDQLVLGDGQQAQIVQRPVTGPSAVGSSASQSVGRGGSGALFPQAQFGHSNNRMSSSTGNHQNRAGPYASTSLAHQFSGASGQQPQQFLPPNAFNSQPQAPGQSLPHGSWQLNALTGQVAAGASPAGKNQMPGVLEEHGALMAGEAQPEGIEAKKGRMAQSKSYKNIRMFNNLLEDDQHQAMAKGAWQDSQAARKDFSLHVKDSLITAQPQWSKPASAAELANRFQARSRSSQGGRSFVKNKNNQNIQHDTGGGRSNGNQALLERRNSRSLQSHHPQVLSHADLPLGHHQPAHRKANGHSGKEYKDQSSSQQNLMAHHIPTIEKIYRQQPDGLQPSKHHGHYQPHLQHQQIASHAQLQQASQNLKHRYVIPKIKKNAGSKNQSNQFKQAQNHILQNKVVYKQQTQQNLMQAGHQTHGHLSNEIGGGLNQPGGTVSHAIFEHAYNSASMSQSMTQLQQAPALSQTAPMMHLLQPNGLRATDATGAQQAGVQTSPDAGRNLWGSSNGGGMDGGAGQQPLASATGLGAGSGSGKMQGQQAESKAPHSQATKRRADNEQLLNYIKVKNELNLQGHLQHPPQSQNQYQTQQPSRNTVAKGSKTQPTESAQQQRQGQSVGGASKTQAYQQQAFAIGQNKMSAGQKQHLLKLSGQEPNNQDQQTKGKLLQTKSQENLSKVQRVQRNELRPKSVKNRPPALTSSTQQLQVDESRTNNAQRDKTDADMRIDEARVAANTQSNRPYQGQGAQMNQTPDLQVQEPQKPTIPTKMMQRNNVALHLSSSQALESGARAQGQNIVNVHSNASNSAQKMAKQTGQTSTTQHPQVSSTQPGIAQSASQKPLRTTSLSSKPRDARAQQLQQRKMGPVVIQSSASSQLSHNLNSKDMVKKTGSGPEVDHQRKDNQAEQIGNSLNTKKTNPDQFQMSSKNPAERPSDHKRQENKGNRKSQDSNASRGKQQSAQEQLDATNIPNITQSRPGKEEKPELTAGPSASQPKGDDAAAPKSKKPADDATKGNLIAMIKHPLKDYYNKLNDDLRGLEQGQQPSEGKARAAGADGHLGRHPLNPSEMERSTNFGTSSAPKKAAPVPQKAGSSEASAKASDYQYAFVSHGGWSADKQEELPNLSLSSSCQGIKEHPKAQAQAGGPQHSKCSFFVLFETIQRQSKKHKVDPESIKGQPEQLKKLARSLQENVLANPNFLHNPTDALASGLQAIRKEALQELNIEDSQQRTQSSPDQSKGGDGTQDFITVREQNLGASAVETTKDGGKPQSRRGLPSQLVVIVVIDDICLCANIGSCRAIMSSKGGGRLYCLNMEHTVPGNEIEEKRILSQMARHKKQARTPQEHAFCRDALTEYIATINLPQKRMIGPVPPREHSQDAKKQKYDNMLDQLQQELIVSEPDITAIQLTDQEEFIIFGSSGLFKRLQWQDLQNVVWQRALMIGFKQRRAGQKEAKVDPAELAETLIQMASIKRSQGNLAALVVLFPVFNTLLNKFVDVLQQAHGHVADEEDISIDFGALRVLLKNPELLRSKHSGSLPQFSHVEHLVEVDEIELEPIPLNEEQDRAFNSDKAYEDTYRMLNADEPTVQDNIDEIIYSQSSFAGLLGHQNATQRRQGYATGRGMYGGRGVAPNMLSSIPEESSIKEMDLNSSSIVTDQNHLGGVNSSGKMDRDLQSLVVPQAHGSEEDYVGSGNRKNHRRFGKNATKFLGGGHNDDSQIKTLEQAPGVLDDATLQTPPAVDIIAAKVSPGDPTDGQLINLHLGNSGNGPDQPGAKDGRLRLSTHHSKKHSRNNSKANTIEAIDENEYGQREPIAPPNGGQAQELAAASRLNKKSKSVWSPPTQGSL